MRIRQGQVGACRPIQAREATDLRRARPFERAQLKRQAQVVQLPPADAARLQEIDDLHKRARDPAGSGCFAADFVTCRSPRPAPVSGRSAMNVLKYTAQRSWSGSMFDGRPRRLAS